MVQKGSLGIDDPPQKSSVHVSQTKSKKGFRKKKGESPFETETNFKINHEKTMDPSRYPENREPFFTSIFATVSDF